jgi:hypothetical protein
MDIIAYSKSKLLCASLGVAPNAFRSAMDFAQRKAALPWANFVVQGPTNKRTRPAHDKSSDSTTPLPNS